MEEDDVEIRVWWTRKVEKIFRIEEKISGFSFFFFNKIFGLEIIFLCVGMVGFDSWRSLLVCGYGGFWLRNLWVWWVWCLCYGSEEVDLPWVWMLGELVEEERWVGGAGKRSLRSTFWRKRRQSVYRGQDYYYFKIFFFGFF